MVIEVEGEGFEFVRADMKTTETQIATLYKHGEQKSISERTKHQHVAITKDSTI